MGPYIALAEERPNHGWCVAFFRNGMGVMLNPRTSVNRDVTMSTELLDTLENKVFSAIETIELLRVEISELKEERRMMEQKVRDLIQRIDNAENDLQTTPLTAAAGSAGNEATPSTFGNIGEPLEKTGTDY